MGRSVGGNPHHTNKRPDKTTRDAFVMSHLLLLLILYASRRVYYYIVTRALIFARPLSSLPACHLLLLHCGLCLIRPSVRPSLSTTMPSSSFVWSCGGGAMSGRFSFIPSCCSSSSYYYYYFPQKLPINHFNVRGQRQRIAIGLLYLSSSSTFKLSPSHVIHFGLLFSRPRGLKDVSS